MDVDKRELLEHQKILLPKFKKMEDNSFTNLNSKIGIFCNPEGSGKAFTVLQYIISQINEDIIYKTPLPTIHYKTYINPYIQIENVYPFYTLTIIICSPIHIDNWIMELKDTSLSYFVLTSKNIHPNIHNYDICICAPQLFLKWIHNYGQVCWNRIIYDEPSYNRIKQSQILFRFVWIIVSNTTTLLSEPKHTWIYHLLQNMHSFELFQTLIVQNSELELKKSYSLSPIYKYKYETFSTHPIRLFKTESIPFKIFSKKIEYENYFKYHSINSTCYICLKDNDLCEQYCILNCCHCQFCIECILQWLKIKDTCPICRKLISNNYVYMIDNQKMTNIHYLYSKEDIILQMIQKKNRKSLIVINNPQRQCLLQMIQNINYKILCPPNHRLENIQKYDILLLDSNYKYFGLNLQFIDFIFFYDKVCPIQHNKILNFVRRIGKNSKECLKIIYFK
jgi:hypothetical protein